MTPPTMNTRSKKCLIPQIVDNLDGNDFFNSNNFFTLPNTLDDVTYVYIIQQDTCLYDIQDLDPEDIAEWLRIKNKQVDKRRMRKMRRAAEIQAGKVKWLRRELRIVHKRSRTEGGVLGIVWWNQEYWGTKFGAKRLGMKKEEPSTPLIKVKHPPTPPLTYPLSWTSTSRFCSIDPNEFVWSPVTDHRPINSIIIFCSNSGHLAFACVSPFVRQARKLKLQTHWAFSIYWYKPLFARKNRHTNKNSFWQEWILANTTSQHWLAPTGGHGTNEFSRPQELSTYGMLWEGMSYQQLPQPPGTCWWSQHR